MSMALKQFHQTLSQTRFLCSFHQFKFKSHVAFLCYHQRSLLIQDYSMISQLAKRANCKSDFTIPSLDSALSVALEYQLYRQIWGLECHLSLLLSSFRAKYFMFVSFACFYYFLVLVDLNYCS